MTLKKGIDILKQRVEKQQEFIKWLQAKDLYNPMESSDTMNKMHQVWESAMEDSYSFGNLWESISKWAKNIWFKISKISVRK